MTCVNKLYIMLERPRTALQAPLILSHSWMSSLKFNLASCQLFWRIGRSGPTYRTTT